MNVYFTMIKRKLQSKYYYDFHLHTGMSKNSIRGQICMIDLNVFDFYYFAIQNLGLNPQFITYSTTSFHLQKIEEI